MSFLTVTNIYRQLFKVWAILILTHSKDKVLTHRLKNNLQFIVTRKKYQKGKEGKEDKGINIC